MIVNYNNETNGEHVKFVSYSGKYPCLCSGTLVLNIDGVDHIFSGYGDDINETTHQKFWNSGGGTNWRSGSVTYGEWEIDYEALPKTLQKYVAEIDSVFNNNVERGCCGGCL